MSQVETLIVGSGVAGIAASRRLQKEFPEMQILILEADDRSGGRLSHGLHLVDPIASKRFPLISRGEFFSAKVRWDKTWQSPENVNWKDKSWVSLVPQWNLYLKGNKRLVSGLENESLEVAIRTRSPVKKIEFLKNDASGSWLVECPDKTLSAQRIIWAAGLTAFQNAFGKQEAQKFLVGNPIYNKEAADFLGGLSLDWEFSACPAFEEGFDPQSLWGLPVRHNGELFLAICTLMNTSKELWSLQSLTHLPESLLNEPKELASFQKSLRRSLNHVLKIEAPCTEKFLVSQKVGGHILGSQWVFGEGTAGVIEFIGDQSLAAVQSGFTDTLAALGSVEKLSYLSDKSQGILKNSESIF